MIRHFVSRDPIGVEIIQRIRPVGVDGVGDDATVVVGNLSIDLSCVAGSWVMLRKSPIEAGQL